MSDSTRYDIRHPDLVIVALGSAVVGYPSSDFPGAAARYDIIALRQIVRIEFLDTPESTLIAPHDGNADVA
jgi:hypothetical protein